VADLFTHKERRLREIEVARREAARLEAIATPIKIKDWIRLAVQDLNEAEMWLDTPDIESRPYIVGIADFAIALAHHRLEMVDFVVRMSGRDATLIG
jgi:hypothetical protein